MPMHNDTLESPKVGNVTEMFPYEMPFRAARAIGLFLIVLFAVAFTAVVAFDVPETVSAPFVLVPESGADPIQSPQDGIIESVHAATQAQVTEGEELFRIRAPAIQDLYAQLRSLTEAQQALVRRRQATVETFAVERAIQEAEIHQQQKEAEYRRNYLSVYRDVLSRFEQLGERGLTSSVDLLSHRLGHAEAERDVALAEERLKSARLALTGAESIHAQELDAMASEDKLNTVQMENIQAQLENTDDDLVTILAPYDGTILSVARKRRGDVVIVGQELCQIAPATARPRAALRVPERGMARLEAGQPVKLLFEAFPYQRYGVVEGALAWLSPAAIEEEGVPVFLAHAEPARFSIGDGDAAHPLRVGMKGEARIQVGRRSMIEYAFEPLRQLRENMRDQAPEASVAPRWRDAMREGLGVLKEWLRPQPAP